MASIIKATATLTVDFSSDILNKEAGELVKDAIKQVVPVIVSAIQNQYNPTPKEAPKEEKK